MEREGGTGTTRDVEWFRALLDVTTDIIAVLAADGEIRYVNGTVEDVLGYAPSALEGRSAFELVHDDDRPAVRALFEELTESGTDDIPSAKFRIRDTDGEWQYLEGRGRAQFQQTPIDGHVISAREITDRKRREQELARYETLIETAPVGLFALDESGIITWANGLFAESIGIAHEEIIGTPFPELVERGHYPEHVISRYQKRIRRLLSDDNDEDLITYREETYPADGGTTIHEARIALLPMADGEFSGSVIAFRDITKQVEYQEALERQNERLDTFASIVSHDLRNPLSIAKGRLGLAEETGEAEHFEAVDEAHDRMETLIDELLSLARSGRAIDERSPTDVEEVAVGAWNSVDTGAAALETDGSLTVSADRSRLRQAFENLFRNAIEHGYSDDRSYTLGESTRDGEAAPPLTVTVGPLDDREGFYVEDDGRGIPPGDRERILEYGYSTDDDGTGFGLGIVASVVDAHGWTVEVGESAAGGARFEIETGRE